MAVTARSFADVLRDVIRNMQEMVRSEIRLVKAEFHEEAVHAKSSALILLAGGALSLLAAIFLVLATVFALAMVMPLWAAALIAGLVLAVGAGFTLASGVRRLQRLHPRLEPRSEAALKESM
ncbi:MAG: phage holin family protein [Paludibaculum sp.]